MLILRTRADLQRLVDEGLEESLTLDYKASPALIRDGKGPDELCKDVSALANSAGGQLVYGVEEDKTTMRPSKIDEGVQDPKITREWIEQILNSKVQPRMTGIKIDRIDMETGKFSYVISVEQSHIGPHQAPDGKYYKRFNLQSVPMHDYEIRDIMRRSTNPDLEIQLCFVDGGNLYEPEFDDSEEMSKTFFLQCDIVNFSPTPAYFAIIELWIDDLIRVPFSSDSFRLVRLISTDTGPAQNIYRRTLAAPPGVPIFKEGMHESHRATIPLQIARRIAWNENGMVRIQTSVQAPGCAKKEQWILHCHLGQLFLKKVDTNLDS
ncbi:helix-turn-helix domain-containing protein [Bradyrhizobium sp. SRS-191]|uniref:AlbA family DNA-binding domain-containing protein n=1 Tax=Bradyrhizobium sp. SRS-191 TaxID=2962606 RepID=UPI00211DF31E|nr:ATP-binding protein [Bradyrhizobium sp. SRS-191]